jgi:hypothetical protein
MIHVFLILNIIDIQTKYALQIIHTISEFNFELSIWKLPIPYGGVNKYIEP